MKKILSIAAMLLFLLWGCSLLKPNNGDQASESPQAQEPPSDAHLSITPPANAGVEGLTSSPTANGAHRATRKQIRLVQQRLRDAGYDPGPVDGIMGPKTKTAIQQYQGGQGISGSGDLDGRTLQSLGVR